MVTYVRGDLFETKLSYIAHGCNCSGSFGAGVAKQIAQRWPIARDAYFRSVPKLGDVQAVRVSDDLTIFNCGTQQGYGRQNGKQYVSYEAIQQCMRKIKQMLPENEKVAMPKIGAGLGGGDWAVIEDIIKEELGEQAVVYSLE